MKKGSLIIVGTGIQLVVHATHEARMSIEQAEKVLYVVADYPTEIWIESINSNAESLYPLYENGKSRIEIYQKMVDRILAFVRDGLNVCAVFYGHPGVFVYPSHEAIRRARLEGFEARMLPGISAEDCLFADLGVDPARGGCQSFEATDFLVYRRKFDPSSSLILWQVGVIGALDFKKDGYAKDGLNVLVEVLKEYYDADHETVVYEASPLPYPICEPSIQIVPLSKLPEANVTPLSTLYVPPKTPVLDESMLNRLKLDRSKIYLTQSCWEQRKETQ